MNRKASLIMLFLKKIQNLPKVEILASIETELSLTSDFIRKNKHNYENRDFKEQMKFYRELKSFRHLLLHLEKDMLLRDKDYKKFEWICEKLVLRGELSERVRFTFF